MVMTCYQAACQTGLSFSALGCQDGSGQFLVSFGIPEGVKNSGHQGIGKHGLFPMEATWACSKMVDKDGAPNVQ